MPVCSIRQSKNRTWDGPSNQRGVKGNDPVQSSTAYLDTYYGFGPYAFELVQGYDCPAYATYLNSTFYVSETTHTQ